MASKQEVLVVLVLFVVLLLERWWWPFASRKKTDNRDECEAPGQF